MKKKYLALLTALMLTAGISTGVQAAELKLKHAAGEHCNGGSLYGQRRFAEP